MKHALGIDGINKNQPCPQQNERRAEQDQHHATRSKSRFQPPAAAKNNDDGAEEDKAPNRSVCQGFQHRHICDKAKGRGHKAPDQEGPQSIGYARTVLGCRDWASHEIMPVIEVLKLV